MRPEKKLITTNTKWLLTYFFLSWSVGIWLGIDFVNFMIEINPIPVVDPKEQLLWVGGLLYRSRIIETAYICAGTCIGFTCLVLAVYTLVTRLKRLNWLKTLLISWLSGLSLASLIATYGSYLFYFGYIHKWARGRESISPDDYLLVCAVNFPAVIGTIVTITVTILVFVFIMIMRLLAYITKKLIKLIIKMRNKTKNKKI